MAHGRMEPDVALYLASVINRILEFPLPEPAHEALQIRMRLCDALVAIGCEARGIEDLPRCVVEWHAPLTRDQTSGQLSRGRDENMPLSGAAR